jgi:cyclopropane fatty-acyl-phospholipid synthase-like methyltransferase
MNTIIKNDWYKDFFAGLNCLMWERAATNDWTRQEVDFLMATLKVQPGAALLDIPCGFGRHTLELAKRGFHMTGIDISAEYVQKLRAEVADQHLAVTVIHGDLLTAEINSGFDGAYCMGNSFGYVDEAGMQLFVQKVAGALKPGAHFVLNSGLVAESILPNFPLTKHYVLGDLQMDIRNTYVVGDSCMATELTYSQADRVEKQYFKHYVYTLSSIKRLLARYGLETVAVYNSTEQLPYQLGDAQLYLVAQKS